MLFENLERSRRSFPDGKSAILPNKVVEPRAGFADHLRGAYPLDDPGGKDLHSGAVPRDGVDLVTAEAGYDLGRNVMPAAGAILEEVVVLGHRICGVDADDISVIRPFEKCHCDARLAPITAALEIAICGVLDAEESIEI